MTQSSRDTCTTLSDWPAPTGDPLGIELAVGQIAAAIFRRHANFPPRQPQALTARMVALATEYLHAHPTEVVRLAELGRLIGVSPWHLAREFARVHGATPAAYQRQLRVRRAAALIAEGSRSPRPRRRPASLIRRT